MTPRHHYTSPKIELRQCSGKGFSGLFARDSILKDEIICVWGGDVYTAAEIIHINDFQRTHAIQVEENFFLVPIEEGDPADYVNHSCDPNAGLRDQVCLVAFRDIKPDEEICFDYAMSDSNDYDEFECACGAPNCRKNVTAQDWKLPGLQKRYKGYFMPYLQRRIDALNKENS